MATKLTLLLIACIALGIFLFVVQVRRHELPHLGGATAVTRPAK
jgi:hypothetical protein